jgi:hypothetical protein
VDGEQHVVAHLGDLAGAERPGVKQVLPHAGEHGSGRLKIACSPPTMKVSVPAAAPATP